jgi:tetratricopeptide (TPR) repeat protein
VSIAVALAHHEAGRLEEAEAAYRELLKDDPRQPGVLHNLGVIAATSGRTEEALTLFDTAIEIEPTYASAHFNRAGSLNALGRLDEATEGFRRTVELEPDHYAAHRALGFVWMARGQRDRALDHFARTLELRRGDDRTPIASASLTRTTHGKIAHDADQFRYLAAQGRDRSRWEALAHGYDLVAAALPEQGVVPLTDEQLDLLGESYNTPFHLRAAPELPGSTLGDAMVVNHLDGIVLIDNLLAPRALATLRRTLLDSTIWFDFTHISGFLASYLEDGLATPLLLQIADDIRAAFPERLGDQPLTQGWAFKGLRGDLPIDLHSDDAAVSVNFWITPDDANTDPTTGGLAIWRTELPAEWHITDYRTDISRIYAWLDSNPSDRMIVPYRENRAVLFDSRMFHGSDAPKFAPGYENMRINITLLFGTHKS